MSTELQLAKLTLIKILYIYIKDWDYTLIHN